MAPVTALEVQKLSISIHCLQCIEIMILEKSVAFRKSDSAMRHQKVEELDSGFSSDFVV